MSDFFVSLAGVTAQMSPYLLLGFLIAGILHVYVPGRFYTKYLSFGNRLSVLYAALLGVPLPLCSCGVIPTAIGLKNELASNGAVASFLIATPQTGIDSILATFSVLGLGFALMRPAAALITDTEGSVPCVIFGPVLPKTGPKRTVPFGTVWCPSDARGADYVEDAGEKIVKGAPQ